MKFKRLSYIIFLVGLTVFMYPHAVKLFFEVKSVGEISEYDNALENMSDEEIDGYIEEMEAYNKYIANEPIERLSDPFVPVTTRSEIAAIPDKVSGSVAAVQPKKVSVTGAFGYIDIPRISQKIPIYLGASNENLAKGVAQLEGTSLPIGGIGTHSVIAGHRGFNRSIPYFKYLNQLVPGDRFYIHVLNRILTYEVVGTEIILPDEREKLVIDPEKDLVTLLTCEPYRVSTHRLLVYAVRVDGEKPIGKGDENRDSIGESEVLSVSYSKELAVSNEVKYDKIISYVVVGVGSVLWIFTFILLLRSFRKRPKA